MFFKQDTFSMPKATDLIWLWRLCGYHKRDLEMKASWEISKNGSSEAYHACSLHQVHQKWSNLELKNYKSSNPSVLAVTNMIILHHKLWQPICSY